MTQFSTWKDNYASDMNEGDRYYFILLILTYMVERGQEFTKMKLIVLPLPYHINLITILPLIALQIMFKIC